MEAIGLLVTLEARAGKEADAEAFLKSAQPLARDEDGTLKWYAIKLGPGKFGIFDTFANETGRNAHLSGEIAKALGARAGELLAAPPQIDIRNLLASFRVHEQITRLVCVEGWSSVAWWAGLRFDDLLRAFPPVSQAKWARIESAVNLGPWGNPDPYFVSLDLSTARHPQTLLATHLNGKPLAVEHGAPIRLVAPVKLGLKNIKAITRIAFTKDEPPDYWAKRGYSRYDGI